LVKFFTNLAKKITSLTVIAVLFGAALPTAYADGISQGVGRTRSCNSNGVPSGLEFFTASNDKPVADPGDDLDLVLSNPVCLAFFLDVYVTVKATITTMNNACGTGSKIPRVYPSPLQDSLDIIRANIKAATDKNPACVAAVAAAISAYGGLTATLWSLYSIAEDAYKNTEICGAKWESANPIEYDFSSANKKQKVKDAVEKYIRDGLADKLTLEGVDNVTYREWYYGGEEVSDNPQGGHEPCYDVTQPKVNGKYPTQKYYMRGLAPGNFNCKKYDLVPGNLDPLTKETVTEERVMELQKAYNCCKKRSANYICINYASNTNTQDNSGSDNKKVFCKAGTYCNIGGDTAGVTFEAKTMDSGRLICAQTYSLCPYNFSIGGGSEYCDYYQDGKWKNGRWEMITKDDVAAGNCSSKSEIRNTDCSYNKKANKCVNYCQYLTHCTTTSLQDYHYDSNLGSPYFSDACINFVGDSQNHTAYGGGFILNSQKHFSAPIAQCVRETLENVFQNVAGHSKCFNENEYPDPNGDCPSGRYVENGSFIYKKGNTVKEESFFTIVQNTLKSSVKMVLTLSIMFYGMNILMGKADIREKKDILMYLTKIALVLFFATGNAWQGFFFKGVYGASSEFSQMVFKIGAEESESRRDGCQFGMITNSNGEEVSSGRLYPSGKEYLALWDTLDCKVMRYLGYGPELKVANIASLILASWLTAPIASAAIYFAVAAMFFGFCFLALTLRALHIFLASSMAIIIMVFVSPIMITMALFAKTNEMFKTWTKELIGYCLQPMILFAYIAFFITITDRVLIGSATFSGEAPSKAINCSKVCKDSNGVIKPYNSDNEVDDCSETGDKLLNPMNDSVACLMSLDDFGKLPGLEMFGLTIPILMNVFTDNIKMKILTMLKGALVMVLLYKFMDEISGIATKLVGGSQLPQSSASAISMMSSFGSFAAKAAARGKGAINRAGGKMGEKAGEKVKLLKEAVRSGGSKGKSVSGGDGGGKKGEGSSESKGDHSE
jgi:type IV secretory pathway VirB6-like protein